MLGSSQLASIKGEEEVEERTLKNQSCDVSQRMFYWKGDEDRKLHLHHDLTNVFEVKNLKESNTSRGPFYCLERNFEILRYNVQ